MKKYFVYFLRGWQTMSDGKLPAIESVWKIGYTSDLKQRMAAIIHGHDKFSSDLCDGGFDLNPTFTFSCRNKSEAVGLEAWVHDLLAEFMVPIMRDVLSGDGTVRRIRRDGKTEWFWITDEFAKQIADSIQWMMDNGGLHGKPVA